MLRIEPASQSRPIRAVIPDVTCVRSHSKNGLALQSLGMMLTLAPFQRYGHIQTAGKSLLSEILLRACGLAGLPFPLVEVSPCWSSVVNRWTR